jgi:hypothetical protein
MFASALLRVAYKVYKEPERVDRVDLTTILLLPNSYNNPPLSENMY